MKVATLSLVAGLLFGLPFSTSAQQNTASGTPSDVQYCNALVRAYQSAWPNQQGMPASDAVTLSRCSSEPRETIAVLEKKLTDKKVALPPDNRIAEQPGSSNNRR
jgi:hypothetical protein